jgi:hypothetical protein
MHLRRELIEAAHLWARAARQPLPHSLQLLTLKRSYPGVALDLMRLSANLRALPDLQRITQVTPQQLAEADKLGQQLLYVPAADLERAQRSPALNHRDRVFTLCLQIYQRTSGLLSTQAPGEMAHNARLPSLYQRREERRLQTRKAARRNRRQTADNSTPSAAPTGCEPASPRAGSTEILVSHKTESIE